MKKLQNIKRGVKGTLLSLFAIGILGADLNARSFVNQPCDFNVPLILAKRGGFSGGRSSFSSGRSSFSSSRGSSSWGSSSKSSVSKPMATKPNSASDSLWGTKANTSTPKVTKVESPRLKTYNEAKAGGTLFSSKAEAQNAFKNKYAAQYTSKYASEPATKPAHIPQAVKDAGGVERPIVYNQGSGGYGYWSGGGPNLGTFIIYDALSDMIMLNMLMNNHNYQYGPPPAPTYTTNTVDKASAEAEKADNVGIKIVLFVALAAVIGMAIWIFLKD